MSIHESSAVIDLNGSYGLIQVSGPDTLNFLQGQFSCDIRTLNNSHYQWGAYCNHKGRMRALIKVFLCQENTFLMLPQKLIPQIVRELKNYARFSKVAISEVSQQWALNGLVYLNEPQEKFASEILPHMDNMKTNHCVALAWPDKLRYVLLSPIDSVLPWLTQFSKQPFNYWKLLDIQALIPEIWPETFECYLPHTLGLKALGAISFNKGCYCGQEIIAKMEYRAHLKRHLYRAFFCHGLEIPVPGTSLVNEIQEPVGTIVDAAPNGLSRVELLIEVSDDLIHQEQSIFIMDQPLKPIRIIP